MRKTQSKYPHLTETVLPGLYWARYKDHGWVPIYVHWSEFMVARVWYGIDAHEIPDDEWFKYQDLRKIEEPEFGS